MIQQSPHQREGSPQIARRERVAQFEDNARARKWDELAHLIGIHSPLFTEKNVDLLQFVIDLSGIAASQQNKQIERVIVELQLSFLRFVANDLCRFLLPAAPA